MLKIKDKVDFKKLEKYGFEYFGIDCYRNNKDDTFNIIDIKGVITEYKGEMSFFNVFMGFEEVELKEEHINDLIQAGIIEKVEEE